MRVELAFFRGDELLCRGAIHVTDDCCTSDFAATSGERFQVQHQFGLPACALEITCEAGDAWAFHSAIQMGVHHSSDWEVLELTSPYELAFRCAPAEPGPGGPGDSGV